MDTVLHRTRALSPGASRAARYIAVGAFGTALYYLVLVLLVEVFSVRVMAATCISFVMVVVANYVLHRVWTFRSPVAHRRAFAPFVIMSAAGFGINSAVMALGLSLQLHYLLVQAAAIGVVVAWNYFFMALIFRQAGTPSQFDERIQDDPL